VDYAFKMGAACAIIRKNVLYSRHVEAAEAILAT
jgi:hypothetical protein